MTGTVLLLVPVLFFCAAANGEEAVSDPPGSLMERIRQVVGDTTICSDVTRPLGSERFAGLPDGRLIVLLQVPDYMCVSSNIILPVVSDGNGIQSIGRELEGAVSLFGFRPGGRLWLATQTQVEASTPVLYVSSDGVEWSDVELPSLPPGWNPFVFLDRICFGERTVSIRLLEESGTEPQRVLEYEWNREISPEDPVWAPIPEGRVVGDCTGLAETHGGWTREEKAGGGEVVFRRGDASVVFPAWIKNE